MFATSSRHKARVCFAFTGCVGTLHECCAAARSWRWSCPRMAGLPRCDVPCQMHQGPPTRFVHTGTRSEFGAQTYREGLEKDA
eukprot:4520716-Amphidinium_carterae.1